MTYEERLNTEKKQIKIICDYLMELCKHDENLVRAINEKEKNSVSGMFKYIKDKAKKEAEDGCAMIQDQIVYDWAREYWLDYEDEEVKNEIPKLNTNSIVAKTERIVAKHKKLEEKQAKEEAFNKLYDGLDLFGGDF